MKGFVFWGLTATVMLAPLPFASNRPWSWSLLSLMVGFWLILWALRALLDFRPGAVSDPKQAVIQVPWARHALATILFLTLVGWFALQASSLAPAAWHHPFWATAQSVLKNAADAAISLNPINSITGLMRILAYAGVFFLALQYGRRSSRAKKMVWALCLAGAVYALYGVMAYFSGDKMILWFPKWAYLDSLTSTFVNRNTFATYAGVTLLVTIVLLLAEIERATPYGLMSRAGWMDFMENLSPRLFFLAGATVVMATALLLTHSRGGFVSTLVGLFVLFLGMALNRKKRTRTLVASVVLTVLAGYVLLDISGGETLSRLGNIDSQWNNRKEVHSLTLEAIADSPKWGTGLGTYGDVFYQHRGTDFYVWTPTFDKAHNTYLEFALEAGLVPTAALVVLFALLFLMTLRGVLKRQRNAAYPCLGLAATALVGTHALIDFSMQIPGMAVTYFYLMGMACAQSWSSSEA